MKILFLTLAGIDDRSFGGAMRSNDIRKALTEVSEVYTFVIDGGVNFFIDKTWDGRNVRSAKFSSFHLSIESIRQRIQVRKAISNLLRTEKFDLIVVRYLGLGVLVPLNYWKRMILDADDLFKSVSVDQNSTLLQRARMKIRNVVAQRLIRFAGHVWFVNPADFNRIAIKHSSILSNAVHLPDIDRPKDSAKAGNILMVGYFLHPPNAEGIKWFIERVLPALERRIPEIQLRLVGKYSEDFGSDFPSSVERLGFVDDLATEYDHAALVIAPIKSGGGTQIKVIDALAYARPLVASAFAHSGFSGKLRDGEHLLVATDEASWVELCCKLLESPLEAEALGARGYVAIEQSFSFEKMVAQVQQTVAEIRLSPGNK